MKKQIICLLVSLIAVFSLRWVYAENELISVFPMDNYSQNISDWIKSDDAEYDKLLLSKDAQEKRLDIYYDHYFGQYSPWDSAYVTKILSLSSPDDIGTMEKSIISAFSNKNQSPDQIGFGENFRPHTIEWIDKITENIPLKDLTSFTYQSTQRGIAIDNLTVRALPTDDVHFYNHKIAGQGYPFDNLQMSAIWIGTPVYIIAESQDKAWMLILSPDVIGWVKSNGVAKASSSFVNEWQLAAKNKLAAITHTQTSLLDQDHEFIGTAYVGSVFPAKVSANEMKLMIPIKTPSHFAAIKTISISQDNAVLMPLAATPHNFARMMQTLIGRPYGWGNSYFYNDCSAELKSLFTPFGIWLPRHSSEQVSAGKLIDKSHATLEERLAYLKENGRKYLTIIYIGGHVILYVGNYNNIVMTYQNMWGLSPSPANRRAVVGQSVLFPMLPQYPEDTTLISHAGKKFFQVSFLDQFPSDNYMQRSTSTNLKLLMSPSMDG